MRTIKEIVDVLERFSSYDDNYPCDSCFNYERGLADGLCWVLGELSSEDFIPLSWKKQKRNAWIELDDGHKKYNKASYRTN